MAAAPADRSSLLHKLGAELECSICQDTLKAPRRLDKCGHMFCQECIHEWKLRNGDGAATITCPDCRTQNPRQLQNVDRRLLNVLALCDFDESKSCEICWSGLREGECKRCRKKTCAGCVAECSSCQQILCQSCTEVHVSLLKVDVMELVEEEDESLVCMDRVTEFTETMARLNKAHSSIEERRVGVVKTLEKQMQQLRVAYEKALQDLEEKKTIELEKIRSDEKSMITWKKEIEKAMQWQTQNRTVDITFKSMSKATERELINIKSQLMNNIENFERFENFNLSEVPSFDYEWPKATEMMWILWEWEQKSLLEPPDGSLEVLSTTVDELKRLIRQAEGDADKIRDTVTNYELPMSERNLCKTMVYNALLKFDPADIVELWKLSSKPPQIDAYLVCLLQSAYDAYQENEEVYHPQQVFARLKRTKLGDIISSKELYELDLGFYHNPCEDIEETATKHESD